MKRRKTWRMSSFSKISVPSPTSQLILQPFPRFTYVTAHSPILSLLHLCHSSFSNPSFASATSQDFHLHHLASRPCTSEVVHHFVINTGFRSCETLNLCICSGIWGPTRHLSLKITNSLAIFRWRKPLKTSTRLAGHGI